MMTQIDRPRLQADLYRDTDGASTGEKIAACTLMHAAQFGDQNIFK